jgi:ferritin-like metal-binding protein YciE
MSDTLRDALIDEIKDLYNAEKQLTKALPKMAKNASNDDLRAALESHLAETDGHVERLEQIFGLLEEKVRGKHCAGMAGIIEEGSEMLEEDFEGAVLDACIIASGQRAEHYEMAAYGTSIAWASALGLTDIADLLRETLEEEKAADKKLSALALGDVNREAASGEDEEDESDDDAEEPKRSNGSARQAAAKTAAVKSSKKTSGRRS